MRLSSNFTLAELTKTSVDADNTPSGEADDKLLYLACYILQPIRNKFGRILVTSGYRSEEVNSAIGGSSTSQYCLGEAVDFIITGIDMWKVYEWIVNESDIVYGQCIFEQKNGQTWIHISLPRLNRANKNALIYDGVKYSNYVK